MKKQGVKGLWAQQRCLLTGATGGIGQAIAKELADRGATLILQGRDKQRLETLAQSLKGQHHILVADINQANDREKIRQTMAESGPFTMLINNAGVGQFSPFEQLSEEEITHTISTNVIAPILLTQALLPLLNQQQAHIVNVGSTFGSIGFAGQTTYCASKFAIRGFSEALYRELADTNIKVSYFAPRATATTINSAKAMAMNKQLGNAVDSPETVAQALIRQLETGNPRQFVGFPERLFVKINGSFPNIVDKALFKKLSVIKRFLNTQ
ncbi:3-oxoacyl-[acyl-carrier-protein] reductase FabG [Marinomonas spartinae]|uniref:3-oxoacyl-[acyl-carrier-protein] reductase FabG n=1 Tax=Marinomonas spartinae TaxID=1792290 RepID=A0A1A8TUH9_9GAMM|nr:SDR family oxidoreductase [Marinomonas spartinae]SBS29696.1 3-oxoacyl-[acyl-carrier-protein] reductase FabG [Marinomonas spartinae]SBS36879.1 3-oxoacyl-[acyl-carrier-protein] reductase FabG [Marinomonas spartinae]